MIAELGIVGKLTNKMPSREDDDAGLHDSGLAGSHDWNRRLVYAYFKFLARPSS